MPGAMLAILDLRHWGMLNLSFGRFSQDHPMPQSPMLMHIHTAWPLATFHAQQIKVRALWVQPANNTDKALIEMAKQFHQGTGKSGTYHYSGAPDASWAGFATEIFAQAGIDCAVTPIPTTDYPTPATRPLNSRLNCSETLSTFGIAQPDWKASLRTVLKELGEL